MPTTSNAAISGLRVVQKQITETQLNIANTLSPDYCQHTTLIGTQVNSEGEAVGATVYGIRRETNEALFSQYQAQNSLVGLTQIKSEYLEQFQPMLGLFGRADDIAAELTGVFNAFETAAAQPENPAMAKLALDALERLAGKITRTAHEVQQQRLKADTEIAESVKIVNGLLHEYHLLNGRIVQALTRGKTPIDAESQRDYICLQIAKYIPVTQAPQPNGANWLYLTDGTLLVSESGVQPFDFTRATAMAPDYEYIPGGGGVLSGLSIDGRDLTNHVYPGKIQGLFDLRDRLFPAVQNQLDAFAVAMQDQLNAQHNAGTAYAAPRTLTGNKTCQGADAFIATGILRVAVVGDNKRFVNYVDLDLGAITTQTVTGFINAINNGTAFGGVAMGTLLTASVTAENVFQIQATDPTHSVALVSRDPNNPAVADVTDGGGAVVGQQGISDYFGLNNMLESGPQQAGEAAVFLGAANRIKVRPELLLRPELYANGTLSRNPAPIPPHPAVPNTPQTWALTNGDSSNGLKIAATYNESWPFPEAGGIVQQDATLKSYATQIVTINGYVAAGATADFASQNASFLTLKEEYKQISGVSEQQEIDTLAMLTQQNTFCTNAAINLQKNQEILNRLMLNRV